MTLPTTYAAVMLLAVFSLLCGGSWPNSVKLTGKWRFELFYFDFSFGFLITAVVLALTLGTFGTDGFVLYDDFMHAGYRNMAAGVVAGGLFNLGNFLLVAAMKLAGLSVAIPIGFGLALGIDGILAQVVDGQGEPGLVFAGVVVLAVAVVFDGWAFRSFSLHREFQKMKAGEHRTLRPSISWKGVVLSVIAGCLMGSSRPFMQFARVGEIGLGPYSLGLAFCAGVFFSTIVYGLYFMNLPIAGPPIGIREYFHAKLKDRIYGLGGGAVWCLGFVASLVVWAAPQEAQINPVVGSALRSGVAPLSTLCGLLAWGEFPRANVKVKALLFLMFFLLLAGLALLALAQSPTPA